MSDARRAAEAGMGAHAAHAGGSGTGTGSGTASLRNIPIEAIEPNPDQPRQTFTASGHEALCRSVARHGVLQPLVVREGKDPGRYQLVAGERRLRAATALGLPSVPAVTTTVPDDQLLELALVENIQREDLNPIEEADAYRRLIERYGYTQEGVAERVGKSRSTVANALRLLELPREVRDAVAEGALSAGHARAICGLAGADAQKELAARVRRSGLSVRETEAAVRRMKGVEGGAAGGAGASGAAGAKGRADADGEGAGDRAPARAPHLEEIERQLRRVLGTKVELVQTARAEGQIVIHFHSDEEFERLLEMFS